MNGRTALITGGSRGIGRAIALKFAALGANVAIFYAGNAEAAEQTVRDIEAQGAKALAVKCDVSNYEHVASAVAQVKEALGGVDILVNNAGITCDKLALRMSPEEFDRVLAVNLNGAFHTIRALYADFMRRRSGRIINIASVAGVMGNAGQANYAASKAGLIGLTKTIARELALRNVTCNAIAPGVIGTDMTAGMNQTALEALTRTIPIARVGTPEDVANLAAFLGGDGAGYITGAVIHVDGGLCM